MNLEKSFINRKELFRGPDLAMKDYINKNQGNKYIDSKLLIGSFYNVEGQHILLDRSGTRSLAVVFLTVGTSYTQTCYPYYDPYRLPRQGGRSNLEFI